MTVICQLHTIASGAFPPPSPEHVWIVCHDESSDNTVLGVFRTQEEAGDYAEEIGHMFENGVIYSSFPVGYRHIDQTSQFFTYEPPPAPSE